MVKGQAATLEAATQRAAALLAGATSVVALVSSWGSNEELAAFHAAFGSQCGSRLTAFSKADHLPQPGEVLEDHLLIKSDKNPNLTAATARYPLLSPTDTPSTAAALASADVVLVWGEGVDAAMLPAGAAVIRLESYEQPYLATADVFIPISIQTERAGHYTNVAGTVTPFAACFESKAPIAHAESLFAQLAGGAT